MGIGKFLGFNKEEPPQITEDEIAAKIGQAKPEGKVEKRSAEAEDISLEEEIEGAVEKAKSENLEQIVNVKEFSEQKAKAVLKQIEEIGSATPFDEAKIAAAIYERMKDYEKELGEIDASKAEKIFNKNVKEELKNESLIPDAI